MPVHEFYRERAEITKSLIVAGVSLASHPICQTNPTNEARVGRFHEDSLSDIVVTVALKVGGSHGGPDFQVQWCLRARALAHR